MLQLSTAVFIMLSVSVVVESRRCYWCGPMADQVHRSRRAPPCDSPSPVDHLTTCEHGLTHCAVVATSPPYTESRLCVKIYQDECYPLFCNSTKTWKMTCPCRGDLCNGLLTDRESEAFTYLAKLVKKTSRIKRAAIDTPKFIGYREKTQTNDDNSKIHEHNGNYSEEIVLPTNEALPAITNNDNVQNDEDSSENSEKDSSSIDSVNNTANDAKMGTVDSQIVTNDAVMQVSAHVSIEEKKENDSDMDMQSDEPAKKEIVIHFTQSTALPNLQMDNNENMKVARSMDTANLVTSTQDMLETSHATEATKPSVNMNKTVALDIKPSDQLPTAEARSQNMSPTEKTKESTMKKIDLDEKADKTPQKKTGLIEKTSVATTIEPSYTSSTIGTVEVTTKSSKSNAATIYIHIYNYISWMSLFFI